jgi:(5-formylfuran-3-yl)methyl phosphate synthase
MDAVLFRARRREEMSVTPRLLVSVRDAAEAEAALTGGAELIDVKEPNRGALGRADAAVIADVVRVVAGKAPVSAALGELRESPLVADVFALPSEVNYLKWGLSGLLHERWTEGLRRARAFLTGRNVVAVAYADWVSAESPRPADIVGYACLFGFPAVLVDAFTKDGTTLLEWLSLQQLSEIVGICRAADVKVALAGSLGPAEIEQLLPLAPDWIAVRGAACEGGRGGLVTADRVQALADLLKRG